MTTQYTVGIRFTGNSSSLNSAAKDAAAAERAVGQAGRTAGAEATSGLKPVESTLERIQAEARATSSAAQQLGTAIKSYLGFQVIKQGIGSLLQAQVAIQQIHYTLQSATGSATAADSAFAFVDRTAQRMGLNLQTAATGFAQLSASASANGVAMADQEKLFTAFGRASSTLHLGLAQSNSALLALEQMFSKGTVQAQELRLQLGQAIPGVMPRFEQAVLRMQQGTANAGKTFDQLLDSGALITKDVLPALTEALSESGRGWEEASTGLNANLNRLSTAWFKLKANVSGGLFSEAASAITGTLAANLNQVAGAASAVAAAWALAYGSRAVASVVGYVQAQRQVLVTAVETTTAELAEARAAEAEAVAHAAKAQAMRASTGTAIEATRAEVVLAAAQARTAEASLAASAAGAARVGMLARVGSSLLALAGGPIGIAVIAVGALAAGWLAVERAEEQRRAAFSATLAQMDAAVAKADALHVSLVKLASTPPPALIGQLDAFTGTLADLAKAEDTVKAKAAEIAAIQDRIDFARASKNGGIALLALNTQLARTQDEFAQLTQKLDLLRDSSNQAGDDLQSRFAPAVQAAAGALANLRAAGNLADVWADLKAGATAYLGTVQSIQDADVKAQALSKQMAQIGSEASAKLTTAGKSQLQIAKDLAAAELAAAKAANWTPAQIKSLQDYNTTVISTVAKVQALTGAHKQNTTATHAAAEAARDLARANADIAQSQRTLDEQNTELQDKLAGLTEQQIEYNRGVRDAVASYQEWVRQGVPVDQAMQALQGRYDQLNDRLQLKNQLDAQEIQQTPEKVRSYSVQTDAAERYYQVIEQGAKTAADAIGNYFVRNVHSIKDLWGGLVDAAKSVVAQIISTWLQLRVLQPILAGVFNGGSGGGLWGSVISAAGSYLTSGGNGGGGGSGGTGGTGAGGSAGSGYGSWLQNIQQARSLYNWAFGGSTAATSSLAGSGASYTGAGSLSLGAYGGQGAAGFNGVTGSGTYLGTGSTSLGAYGGNVTYAPYGGMYSIGGYSAPLASYGGAVAGAYYGAHQGDGSFGTVGSTVAYGALGAGIAGTAAGVAGGASVGTAAGSAFGATAASASWIPIVGWIAALAALVDHFSGGKVFGTKYRTNASDVALSIGPDGSSADASVRQWKYRSQLSQSWGRITTGGALLPSDWGDKDRRFKHIAVTPEMTAAAKALYDSIEKTLVTGAQKLGVDVPAMLEASLSAQSTYNKKGKLQGTSYVVDYLGRTWKEATADAAAQRIGAEALVKVVEASAGAVAQKIAEQFRSSAETLLDGATTMLEAQADINKGNSLVALGATATLAQIVEFTKGLQADGEKLADTYTRLMQASAAYLQFVGQFKAPAVGFGAALQAISAQMHANIDQANALAQAAGLQGAREEDLANIHSAAAHQAAEAIAQLSAAAQDLATKLYGATSNTLASVLQQIDKLNAKVQTATQLAIGDNSPLNDKEKLDLALKGLRSGITSADDVLALGRKLYASSADYTGLYNKVTEIMGLPTASGTGAGSIDSALTDYNKLIGQRDQYQAQADQLARYNDAKTLAQYVADISTTHGIGYGEAASGLGFSLQDLAKDLGLTNISGYLDTLKQQDIAGTTLTASSSIVDAIRQLGRDLIQTITNGPLVTPGPGSSTTATPASDQQLALLQQINDRLAALEGPIASTATTNHEMLTNTKRDFLRGIAVESRA